MIASEIPFMKLNGFGQCRRMVCTSSAGSNANRKPKKRIRRFVHDVDGADDLIDARESRTPTTLMMVRNDDDPSIDDEVFQRARVRRATEPVTLR